MSLPRRAFGIYASGVIFIGIAIAAIFASGWWPASPKDVPGFGATVQRCELAYGHPTVVTTDKALVNPRSRGYVKRGWFIMVGFDEKDQAEQFVFSKSFPLLKSPTMNEAEQKTLLEGFKENSAWIAQANNGNGPIWKRADDQAHASYIADQHWLVLMNAQGMERSIKALPQNAGEK